ncbi:MULTISPECIES: hypothetical protein [unclassified Arenibacter]|uniref:hypothetical protein n=1 Tax=unclassified Arenibacter TaxID=2615047 RepID=UPI000E34830B|nr:MULTISPECIES: hypothetical protein [unclassified Arenibacter]MCM4162989.1 hypothetical protein [Arenibacter sp. A80]RFT57028.1 hypothetical protein D0S24_05220 [Arenibacter sp. P308M17]
MKKIIILLAVAALGCQKDDLDLRPLEFGSLEFSLSTPKASTNSTYKVPSCKGLEPNEVHYNLTSSQGVDYKYKSSVTMIEGKYVSTANTSNTLPYGNYTLNDVSLVNGNDTIFALPHEDEFLLSPFWDTTLPMDIKVSGSETVSGSVFCFNEYPAPDLDGIVEGGFDPREVQSLYFVTLSECIDRVVIEFYGKENYDISPQNGLLYHIVIPLNYVALDIWAYSGSEVVLHTFFTTGDPHNTYSYNADGVMTKEDVLIFEDCPSS